MSAMPLPTLPKPARAQRILDLAANGWDATKVAGHLGGGHAHQQVARIMGDPARFNPHIDAVAVQRAYEGNQDAWVGLTHYERAHLVDRLLGRADAGLTHVRWVGEPAVGCGAAGGFGWLGLWCVEVGEEPERFLRILNKRRFATRHAA